MGNYTCFVQWGNPAGNTLMGSINEGLHNQCLILGQLLCLLSLRLSLEPREGISITTAL